MQTSGTCRASSLTGTERSAGVPGHRTRPRTPSPTGLGSEAVEMVGFGRPSLEPVLVGARRGEKDQAELAYLDFVAVGQDCRLHRLTVDVGAVEAADVDDLEFAVVSPEFGVPAADGDVIAEDVAVGVSAGGRHRLIQHEPRARVRAALDHEQC